MLWPHFDEFKSSLIAPMNPKNRNFRKSIRLKDYDYSQPGEYFVTICTHSHEFILGEIIQDGMQLNIVGKIAEKCWREILRHFPNVELWRSHPFGR